MKKTSGVFNGGFARRRPDKTEVSGMLPCLVERTLFGYLRNKPTKAPIALFPCNGDVFPVNENEFRSGKSRFAFILPEKNSYFSVVVISHVWTKYRDIDRLQAAGRSKHPILKKAFRFPPLKIQDFLLRLILIKTGYALYPLQKTAQ